MVWLKIGVEVATLGVPLKRALPLAAQLGADGVEISARGELAPGQLSQTGMRQLRKMLEDHRLAVAAVAFRTRRGYDTPADLDRRVEATKEALRFAYQLGCPVVVNHIGQVPAEADNQTWELLAEVLTDLALYGLHVGAVLAAETGTESGPQMARLLEKLPEAGLGVDFNPGNLIANGHNPLEAVEALGPWILHVHTTDGVCDLARRRGQQVPVGQGAVDFPALLGALGEYDYRGYFTVGDQRTEDPAEGIAQVIRFLRRL
ncbi:MAG TPA: sugar phosphate isomerase/epimerase [Planctomycetaceae bacterium]|nr:sugar phosphate isomerase/epimerase [Planctomycetaceae bacterium]